MKKMDNLLDLALIVCGLVCIGGGVFLIWLTVTTHQVMDRINIAPTNDNGIYLDSVGGITLNKDILIDTLEDGTIVITNKNQKPFEDLSTPAEAGFVCKHCSEPLYRQYGGRWVHATFDDGGFINCKDHADKKANQDNWGKYPIAEPAARV